MYRVLQVFTSLQPGGMELQTLNLVKALRLAAGFEVHAAALGGDGPLLGEVEELGLPPVPRFPLRHMYGPGTARQFARLVRYLARGGFDVVHTHDFYTTVFALPAARLCGVPVRVASRRELDVFTGAQRRVERGAMRLATAVFANCDFLAGQLLAEGVPATKVHVLANGIGPGRVAVEGGAAARLRAELGISGCALVVTMIANLHNRRKDFVTFVQAAARVACSRPDTVFVIAGAGDPAEVRALAAGSDPVPRLLTPGLLAHVGPLLASSDVVVLTSHSEGLPNALLEAMAAGVPVVASAVGGTPELVRDGETGFLVPPAAPTAVAGRVLQLLENAALRQELGASARQYVNERYSTERQAEALLSLYERLLAGRRRTGAA